MQRVITALRMASYEVLCTVTRPKRHICSNCGHAEWPRSGYGYGASPGVPDLLVRHPDWEPQAFWLAIETKGSHTPLNAAQKALYAAGAIVVARSVQAALLAVQQTSHHFNGR